MSHFDHIQVAVSRLLNSVLFANCRLMLSSEVHKRNHWLEKWINKIFFWEPNHCKRCFEWEQEFNR